MRTAKIQRDTKETRIEGRLSIEGRGRYDISTGIRFLDHMLELFAKHGGFDLTLKAVGDLDVDQHHTVEDTGIVLDSFDRLYCRIERRGHGLVHQHRLMSFDVIRCPAVASQQLIQLFWFDTREHCRVSNLVAVEM